MGNNNIQNRIFHIHTYRCGHAENVSDEAYVQKALALGGAEVWFTDHAPFPDDPFRGRMSYQQLDEYLSTLTALKEKYEGLVHIGLEIEYLPSFDKQGYYEELMADPRLEVLMLGQHMAEDAPGSYTFSWDKERLSQEEYVALGNAVCEGLKKGYFGVLAHPDRIFRRQKVWTEDMQCMANKIVCVSAEKNVPLELNMHSVAAKHQYWPKFWNALLPENKVFLGLDAHSIDQLERRFERGQQWSERFRENLWLDEIPSVHVARYNKCDLDTLLADDSAKSHKPASKSVGKDQNDQRA